MEQRPVGPYRDAPQPSVAPPSTVQRRRRWLAGSAVASIGVGALVAPELTAATVGALFLYVFVPWFITRAQGR